MDTNNLIAYSKIYEHLLGNLPSAHTYEERIISQKIAFLIQDNGIYLGEMDFFWHKRGPYSRSLASALRYLDRNFELIEEECERVKLNSHVSKGLENLKHFIEHKPSSCDLLYWLELSASLKFLSKEVNSKDINVLTKILLSKKPFLKEYKSLFPVCWDLINNVVPA